MSKFFSSSIVFLFCVAAASSASARVAGLAGTNFSAPTVCGYENVRHQSTGDIVYDDCREQFYGYYGAIKGWEALGGVASSFKAPTIQKLTSGSGTYVAPTNPTPLYLKVRIVGGGAGGQGSGSSPGSGGSGAATSFGGTLLVANGGVGRVGGSASIGAGASGLAIAGGEGGTAVQVSNSSGGVGGSNSFAGAGAGGGAANSGSPAVANTGAGGGGAGGVSGNPSGAGGGSGGYLEAVISNPDASYAYSVGAGGAGGAAGGAGYMGGAGASGIIIVEEFYQ